MILDSDLFLSLVICRFSFIHTEACSQNLGQQLIPMVDDELWTSLHGWQQQKKQACSATRTKPELLWTTPSAFNSSQLILFNHPAYPDPSSTHRIIYYF